MTPTDDDRKAAVTYCRQWREDRNTTVEDAYLQGRMDEREQAAWVARDAAVNALRAGNPTGFHIADGIAAAIESGCTPGCTPTANKPEQTGTNRDGSPESAPRPEPRENPGESAI